MRCLKRNERTIWYALYDHAEEIIDEAGYPTGEYIPVYGSPVEMKANVSPATGSTQTEQFGSLEDYDKVIVTCDTDCPIDENTVLFIDRAPAYSEAGTHTVIRRETVLGDDEIEENVVETPLYDYTVRRVAKSLNSVSIAARKVAVS